MGQVRSKRLDNLCESIAEARETMNAASQQEKQDIAAALQVMQKEGRTAYRNARVELSRVPGAEKLRVRLTKEEGNAGDGDLEQPESHEDVAGESEGRSDIDDAADALGGEGLDA